MFVECQAPETNDLRSETNGNIRKHTQTVKKTHQTQANLWKTKEELSKSNENM